tara:strand:+ start:250 stop:516 length:267 start_codon:yes stop_codon:yes gene_type:complete
VIVSKELLKKVGIGVLALLVVCNTVRIQEMKKDSKKTREAFSGMRARMGEAYKMQRPALGQRGPERGQRPDKGKREGNKGKQQKKEAK